MIGMRKIGFVCLVVAIPPASGQEPIPDAPLAFIESHCLECHDADTEKGEINLDLFDVDWSDKGSHLLWERALNAVKSGEMPPEEKARPGAADRETFLSWIDTSLLEHTGIGGTLARRLNQAEYKATVARLFDLKDFELPPGFPGDREFHGFDNVGEGLVLSPPLLEAYAESARLVADRLFPPPDPPATSERSIAGPDDLVISYSSGKVVDDALRLGMSCEPIQRSSTWPTRIEAEASGVYRLRLRLSTFRPAKNGGPMVVKVLARDVASADGVAKSSLRLLEEFEVDSEKPEEFEFEAELYEEQTPVIHWDNAAFSSDRDKKEGLQAYFAKRDQEIPGFLSAWAKMVSGQGQGFRGGVGWERVSAILESGDLPDLDEKARADFLKKVAGNPVLYAETVVFDVFENGPALEVHELEIEGPLRLVDGPSDRERLRLQQRFFGKEEDTSAILRRFLSDAFRRPVDDNTLEQYVSLFSEHQAAGFSREESMHLVIRKVLLSPRFLYRSLHDGSLDDFDLATRLSYFLTGRPADDKLLEKAAKGMLSDPDVLRGQAERLIPSGVGAPFITNFTGQWLDTRLLPEIMPDPSLKFSSNDEQAAAAEVEHLFFEILRDNRPMTDFIDPDFTWTSARVAQGVYGLTEGFDKKKANAVHRVSLERGGRAGGVVGNAAVMMATANGVDTQPVLRGVWILENILGMPPPPPPKAVPALTPDTQGATTPRELLAAHTDSESCAGCHKRIDPIGFVLENFDPVGRWRENWPGKNVPVDATGILPDGTEIANYLDFKAWLVENVDLFSECLAEKLLTYATGRVPNYSEREEIEAIVRANEARGGGFRDLLIDLVDSETFRTK